MPPRLGLVRAAIEKGLDSGKHADGRRTTAAEKAGEQPTPAFFVKGPPRAGAVPYSQCLGMTRSGKANSRSRGESVAAASPAAPPAQ